MEDFTEKELKDKAQELYLKHSAELLDKVSQILDPTYNPEIPQEVILFIGVGALCKALSALLDSQTETYEELVAEEPNDLKDHNLWFSHCLTSITPVLNLLIKEINKFTSYKLKKGTINNGRKTTHFNRQGKREEHQGNW